MNLDIGALCLTGTPVSICLSAVLVSPSLDNYVLILILIALRLSILNLFPSLLLEEFIGGDAPEDEIEMESDQLQQEHGHNGM